MRCDILGVGFDAVDFAAARERALELAGHRGGGHVIVTPNAEIVMETRRSPDARKAIAGADLVLPDGVGIVKAAGILGYPIRERVSGIDLAEAMFPELARTGRSLYLLGAKPGIAAAAAQRLSERFDGLRVCGTADGYFDDEEAAVRAIRQSGAEVVFVCLGAPRQELFMQQWRHETGAALHIGLGGSFDVWSGTVARAPDWMQRAGLEWFYRLARQPSRAWRMRRLPQFLMAVRKQKRGTTR